MKYFPSGLAPLSQLIISRRPDTQNRLFGCRWWRKLIGRLDFISGQQAPDPRRPFARRRHVSSLFLSKFRIKQVWTEPPNQQRVNKCNLSQNQNIKTLKDQWPVCWTDFLEAPGSSDLLSFHMFNYSTFPAVSFSPDSLIDFMDRLKYGSIKSSSEVWGSTEKKILRTDFSGGCRHIDRNRSSWWKLNRWSVQDKRSKETQQRKKSSDWPSIQFAALIGLNSWCHRFYFTREPIRSVQSLIFILCVRRLRTAMMMKRWCRSTGTTSWTSSLNRWDPETRTGASPRQPSGAQRWEKVRVTITGVM